MPVIFSESNLFD